MRALPRSPQLTRVTRQGCLLRRATTTTSRYAELGLEQLVEGSGTSWESTGAAQSMGMRAGARDRCWRDGLVKEVGDGGGWGS
jgi:hypothetical protein